MQTEEKLAKVKELRESLRNGRENTTGDASPEGYSGSDDQSFRSDFQDHSGTGTTPPGNIQQASGDHQQSGGDRRNHESSSKRPGWSGRRSRKSDSSTVSNPASSESTESIESKKAVGRIVADGPIKERSFAPETEAAQTGGQIEEQPKRRGGWPKGKPRKGQTPGQETFKEKGPVEETSKLKLPLIRKGNVLSATEARDLAEPLIASLEDDFQALDSYLWSRQKGAGVDTNNQPVWSDLDTEEINRLTGIMLKWGQHNETAATVVRTVVDASDYVAVGSIFIPRITRTVEIMRTTHKPRPKRGQAPNEGAHKQ